MSSIYDVNWVKIVLKPVKYLVFGEILFIIEIWNLNKDLNFKDVKIDIESADKMTDNEKDAFVRNHFENK
ncbi:MAG: hypothetical protein GZ086_06230 [Gelidibacter sp.]|nr:hypothetical protein [Gelidibacter sp.]